MKGLVYKSTGSWYQVKDEQGRVWNTRVKGKLKIDGDISSTNPIAVGDHVNFDIEDEAANTAIVISIEARHNYIVRVSPHNKNQKHIVGANLDLALLIVTIAQPRTSLGFIDRFLVTAEAYHIPAILVVNKTDLLDPDHSEILERWRQIYNNAGYEVFAVSALHQDNLNMLKQRLKGQITLFSGHSGVGKSTLLNQLIPELNLRTEDVSGWSGKGQHTTTFAEMFDLPDGGSVIDTPGVKEFGLIDMEQEELSHYFPEMRALMSKCRFNNCLHINEPGCAIKEAVVNGHLPEERYHSYIAILNSIENKW